MDSRWQQLRNVLVVRLDNLGDVLLMTPAIRAIRRGLPAGARLTLLAGPVGAQVAALDPDIDDVIVYASPQFDPWQRLPFDRVREFRLIGELRRRHFDGAVIFTSFRQSALPIAYLCYLAGIPLRAAASVDGAGSLLTTRHKHPEHLLMHEVERALDLVGALGFMNPSPDLVLDVPAPLRAEAATRLATRGASRRPLVIIHPGCTMPARTYPADRYVDVARRLVKQLDCQIVFTGSPDEVDLVAGIQARLDVPSLSLAGETDFRQLAALIAIADLVVTNNTGPMHIAAAVKTPVVALFALTNPPQQWGPWRVPHRLLYRTVPCAICYSRICPTDHGCLQGVTADEVVAAAAELLSLKQTTSFVTPLVG